MDGFERGRNLDKIGLHSQDTAELFFTDVQVPAANLLGTEGQGFLHLVHNLPQERLSIAAAGVAAAEAALGWTLDVLPGAPGVRSAGRVVPEQPIRAGHDAHRDRHRQSLRRPLRRGPASTASSPPRRRPRRNGGAPSCRSGSSTAASSSTAGYGYMLEYPIARAYVDARVTTIYGGTTEIMKEIIGRPWRLRRLMPEAALPRLHRRSHQSTCSSRTSSSLTSSAGSPRDPPAHSFDLPEHPTPRPAPAATHALAGRTARWPRSRSRRRWSRC